MFLGFIDYFFSPSDNDYYLGLRSYTGAFDISCLAKNYPLPALVTTIQPSSYPFGHTAPVRATNVLKKKNISHTKKY